MVFGIRIELENAQSTEWPIDWSMKSSPAYEHARRAAVDAVREKGRGKAMAVSVLQGGRNDRKRRRRGRLSAVAAAAGCKGNRVSWAVEEGPAEPARPR